MDVLVLEDLQWALYSRILPSCFLNPYKLSGSKKNSPGKPGNRWKIVKFSFSFAVGSFLSHFCLNLAPVGLGQFSYNRCLNLSKWNFPQKALKRQLWGFLKARSSLHLRQWGISVNWSLWDDAWRVLWSSDRSHGSPRWRYLRQDFRKVHIFMGSLISRGRWAQSSHGCSLPLLFVLLWVFGNSSGFGLHTDKRSLFHTNENIEGKIGIVLLMGKWRSRMLLNYNIGLGENRGRWKILTV